MKKLKFQVEKIQRKNQVWNYKSVTKWWLVIDGDDVKAHLLHRDRVD